MYSLKDYDGAWRVAHGILQVHPDDWQSWQMIGNCKYAKGDHEGTLVSYQRSLEIHPDNLQLKSWLEKLRKEGQR